jgi:hypothetical protein
VKILKLCYKFEESKEIVGSGHVETSGNIIPFYTARGNFIDTSGGDNYIIHEELRRETDPTSAPAPAFYKNVPGWAYIYRHRC